MAQARFGKVPFTVTSKVVWEERTTIVEGPWPARLDDLMAILKSGAFDDLVLPARTTRAAVLSWSVEQERAQSLLTVVFTEDPEFPELAPALTSEEMALFKPGARRMHFPSVVFLTAEETGGSHYLGGLPALEERPSAPVAVVAGAVSELAIVPEGLVVHRHLARRDGALVWLYTTDPSDE